MYYSVYDGESCELTAAAAATCMSKRLYHLKLKKKKKQHQNPNNVGLGASMKGEGLGSCVFPLRNCEVEEPPPKRLSTLSTQVRHLRCILCLFFFYPLLTLVDDKCFTGKTLVRACVHAFTPRVTAWSPPRWAAAPPCSRRQRHRRESQRRHAFQGRERSAPSARCP